MAFSSPAGLNIAGVDRDVHGFPISGRSAAALHNGIKAIFPKTVIFFPLSLNVSQLLTFGDDPLASRVTLSSGMTL